MVIPITVDDYRNYYYQVDPLHEYHCQERSAGTNEWITFSIKRTYMLAKFTMGRRLHVDNYRILVVDAPCWIYDPMRYQFGFGQEELRPQWAIDEWNEFYRVRYGRVQGMEL
jgi:hypothetical protein